MTFGETLTQLRKSKGFSQEQLAWELGLTRQTISKWELNQSTPDLDYLVRLSNFFDVTTDYLIKGEPSSIRPFSGDSVVEPKNPVNIQKQVLDINAYKWCFYLGTICIGAALVGIIAFVICSALNPWTALVNNLVYDGLLGFLIGTKTLWFFALLVVLFLAGSIASVFAIVNNIKNDTHSK